MNKEAIDHKAVSEMHQRRAAIDHIKKAFNSILMIPETNRFYDNRSQIIDAMALEIAILTGLFSGERQLEDQVEPLTMQRSVTDKW